MMIFFSLMCVSHLALIIPNVQNCRSLHICILLTSSFFLSVWLQSMAEGQTSGKTQIWKFNSTRASRDSLPSWLKLCHLKWWIKCVVQGSPLVCFVQMGNLENMEIQGMSYETEIIAGLSLVFEAGHLTPTMTLKGDGLFLKGPRLLDGTSPI